MSNIRRIKSSEGSLIRELRLRALSDTPKAFGETLDEAKRKSDDQYKAYALLRAESDSDAIFVAEKFDQYIGMIGAFFENKSVKPFISSMWVSPGERRTNTGADLFLAALEWLKSHDAKEVNAWVAMDNTPAIKFYEKLSFVGTNMIKPMPSDKNRDEKLYVYIL